MVLVKVYTTYVPTHTDVRMQMQEQETFKKNNRFSLHSASLNVCEKLSVSSKLAKKKKNKKKTHTHNNKQWICASAGIKCGLYAAKQEETKKLKSSTLIQYVVAHTLLTHLHGTYVRSYM